MMAGSKRKIRHTTRKVRMEPIPPAMTPKRMLFLPSCFIVARERMATSLPSMSMALNARRKDPIMTTVGSVIFVSTVVFRGCVASTRKRVSLAFLRPEPWLSGYVLKL